MTLFRGKHTPFIYYDCSFRFSKERVAKFVLALMSVQGIFTDSYDSGATPKPNADLSLYRFVNFRIRLFAGTEDEFTSLSGCELKPIPIITLN